VDFTALGTICRAGWLPYFIKEPRFCTLQIFGQDRCAWTRRLGGLQRLAERTAL